MNMIFQLSRKTEVPFCGFSCCGNKFGRIERSQYAKVHGRSNRMRLTRRYAKHVERQIVKRDIQEQLLEELLDIDDFNREMAYDYE